MNHRPLNSLPLGKAITGYANYKTAEGLSDRSVDSYNRILEHWAEFAGNKNVAHFTDHDINPYLVYMRTEYVPSRWSGDTRNLSTKVLQHIWNTMCSFFTWANSEFRMANPMKRVPIPRFQKVDVEPFTQDEIECMLKACTYSREADTFIRRKFAMRCPTLNRDQAIILTLLDSGIRASEFSSLRVGDFDPKRGKLEIRHGAEGGKGRLSIWARLPGMLCGDIWLNGRMAKNQMHLCSPRVGTVLSTLQLYGT